MLSDSALASMLRASTTRSGLEEAKGWLAKGRADAWTPEKAEPDHETTNQHKYCQHQEYALMFMLKSFVAAMNSECPDELTEMGGCRESPLRQASTMG